MALIINGTGQESFNIDGIDIDNLYVDGVLVFSSTVKLFSITVTATSEPYFASTGGTLIYDNNGDGTWEIYSYDPITSIMSIDPRTDSITKLVVNISNTLTSCYRTFGQLINMTELDLTNMDTSNCTTMEEMFYGCHSMITLNLTPLDFSGITTTIGMFRGCTNLTCISNVDTTASATSAEKVDMFRDCFSLEYPNATDIADITDGNGANWVSPVSCFGDVFEMNIQYTSDPTLDANFQVTGGTVESVEILPNLWRLSSEDNITWISWRNSNSGGLNATYVKVIKGGTLTSLSDMLYNFQDLTSFEWVGSLNPLVTDLSNAWGFCYLMSSFVFNVDTVNVTNFEGTWQKCTYLSEFPVVDTSNGTNFKETWDGIALPTAFPLLDLSNGLNFEKSFSYCYGLMTIPVINTSSGLVFDWMFVSCTSLLCIGALNTTNQTSTQNMFSATDNLIYPNATDQALILAGHDWINTIPCPTDATEPPIYVLTEELIDG